MPVDGFWLCALGIKLLINHFEEGIGLIGGGVIKAAVGSQNVGEDRGPGLEVGGCAQGEGLVGFADWGDLDGIVGEGKQGMIPGENAFACTHITAGPNGPSDAALVDGRVGGRTGSI